MQKQEVLRTNLTELYGKLKTSENGLSDREAAERLATAGPNILQRKGAGALSVLLRQFKSSLIYFLIAASAISYGIKDYSDGTVILVILLINTLLGFSQEYRSEKIIEKLSKFISHQIYVRRSGEVKLVDESNIVPGDVLIIREGDIAPADIRLFEAQNLLVNESELTGESVPVVKHPTSGAPNADCLIFAGSVVEKGEGIGVAYATGNDTELGTIAKLSTETKKETQYERSLRSFSSFLMKVALLGLAPVFMFKLILNLGLSNATGLLLFIIAMAVAIVPEALPVIATVTLSSGALKLAKKHVVVRRLTSLEDLGNVNLLCTDKTGTITENKMTIKKITSTDERLFQMFAYVGITPLKSKKKRTQNSYDDAFTRYISEDLKKEARHFKMVKEFPFDPEDRRSRLVIEDAARKKHFLISIGAPEALLAISGGENKAKYLRDIAREGGEGLHHLAIAYKEISYTGDFDILKNERNLIFLGYASLEDPLRPTAESTIRLAEKLGIKIKILTGDSGEVARYVGSQIGLLNAGDKVYLGSELEKMPEDKFKAAVQRSQVFARVSPTQKFKIIKALKETNVVGYQGDGINDAPALKLADVAIAVNSATDIAKENADIVLLNRSLEVVVNGIKYGRSIFVNINKYIRYTMVSNFGNFIALSTLYLFSADLPMLPIQVLLTTVITDIPLITIYSDTVEESEVVRPEQHNVKELVFISLILGVPTALFELFYFMIIHNEPLPHLQTNLYLFFTLIGLIVFYAVRNKRHFWKAAAPSTLVNASFASGFIFSLAIIYTQLFQGWFSFVPLRATSIGLILVLMLFYFFAADFVKVWYYASSEIGRPKTSVKLK